MKILLAILNHNFIKILLVMQALTRIILSIYAVASNQVNIIDILSIMLAGFLSDLVVVAYFTAPVLIGAKISQLLIKKPISQYIFNLINYYFYILLLIFTIIAELVFWDEYGTRFNFIAVDYLIYTQEIIGTLKDSLPLVPIIIAIGLSAAIITYQQRNKIYSVNNIKNSEIIICLLFACLSANIYDSSSYTISKNRFSNELALNGPYEFIKAFINNSLDYNKFYPTISQNDAINTLQKQLSLTNTSENDDISRIIKARHATVGPHKYNIILLTVESLSAEFIGYYGSKQQITPNIDEIIKESLVFDKIYAVGTRTVRGLEALSLSVPPTPGSSIVRRPDNDNLFNISSLFNNAHYDVKFIFGGYSYFDNLKNFFSRNYFDVIDRADLRSDEISFANVWGVADEDILKKALSEADKSYAAEKKFFQFIMTTSNHRPYSFPSNRIDLASGSNRAAAVKYTDYAIGEFIRLAKQKPWFANTIFIITADHCAASAGKMNLPIHKYHIPLIIYAPKIIAPAVNNTLASQIDIPPTIFGLLNWTYNSKFFGQDIINSPPNRAFISTYQLLGYYRDDQLVVLAPNKNPILYAVESKEYVQIENNQQIITEAISYYQTAYNMFITRKLQNF